MRRQIPILLCFGFGAFMLVQFFIPAWTNAYETAVDWTQTIFIFTLLVGVVGMVKYHAEKISRKVPGYGYNIVTLVGVAVMAFSGLFWGRGEGTAFTWMFDYMQAPMQATVFSLLAFFVASAAYRGFKIRNFEASLLLFAAILVMIGRVPMGELISPYFPKIANWILTVPSMTARRGIFVGIGLGTIATSLRVILGVERTYLGRS
ncbi:MAG: hypothetical protein GY839_19060 [candidate division Zixibacteria bacterium]|nr:hypothetical protein [candidate division Zixibacteria bacterium]